MNLFVVDKDELRPYGTVVPIPVGQSQFSKVNFRFSPEWDGFTKIAQFKQNSDNLINVDIEDNSCIVPTELGVGLVRLRVRGYPAGEESAVIATANEVVIPFVQGFEGGGTPAVPPTPDLYAKLLKTIGDSSESSKTYAENAKKSAEDAAESATQSQTAAKEAEVSAKAAAGSAGAAKRSEEASKESENSAGEDATKAEESKQAAAQALSDLLKMLGSDICPLVQGTIPLKYIPATATTEIYEITSELQLTGLDAQRGDLAELIEVVNEERTVTKTWQLLGDDASVRANWVVWGTSYAVAAGYATTAGTAENATKINNHRMVEMTDEAFATAVKDPNTYYLVYAEAST